MIPPWIIRKEEERKREAERDRRPHLEAPRPMPPHEEAPTAVEPERRGSVDIDFTI